MKHLQYLVSLLIPAALALGCGGSEAPAPAAPAVEDEPPTKRLNKYPHADDDDDDDSDLEVEGLRGRIAPGDAEAAVSPHAGSLQRCYTDVIGKRKYIGGRVELKFFLSKDGILQKTQVLSSDLGAWPVEKCLLDVAKAMTFKKPKGGPADFTLPLEFSARGNAIWWDADRGDAEVGERRIELAACAEEVAVEDPSNVMVTLYIGTRGQVQSVGFANQGAEPIAEAWANCAEAKALAWTLSDPKGRVAKIGFGYNAE